VRECEREVRRKSERENEGEGEKCKTQRKRRSKVKKRGLGKEGMKGGSMGEEIKVMFWNVAGLRSKDEEFWEFVKEYEVVGLIETWVEEKEWERWKGRMPEGWRWKCQGARRESKNGRAMGGIITGVKKELEEKGVEDGEGEGIQERRVKIKGEWWRVVTVYNRGGGEEVVKNIEEVVREGEEEKLLLGGDFNARIGRKGGMGALREEGKEPMRESKDGIENKQGRKLLEVVEDRGWAVLNGAKEGDERGEWTYEKAGKKSVIDIGIVNWEAWERVVSFKVENRIDSDHQPVIVGIRGDNGRGEEIEKERGKMQDWSKDGVEWFRKKMEEVEWKCTGGIEEEWSELVKAVGGAVKERERKRKKKIGWCPWRDRECREEKKKVQNWRRKVRNRERRENESKLRKIKQEYKKLCDSKKIEYRKKEEKEIEEIKTEAQAWEFINRGRKKKEGVCKEISMEEWVRHFVGLLGGAEERRVGEGGRSRSIGEEIKKVKNEEIEEEIKRLKKGKAAGDDGIRNEVWKVGGEKVVRKLGEIIWMSKEGMGR
jgi:hypothetical protein